MIRKALLVSAAVLVIACGGSSSGTTASTTETSGAERAPRFSQISVDDVSTAMTTPGSVAIFDANSQETYAQHHVPTATWVDYDAVRAEQLPTDRATQLVFYCANEQCEASHVAAESAIDMGYTSVAVMPAGIEGWVAAGKPVETGAAAAPAAPQ
jgi:rhodanese-related sulfurtransferase